MGVWGPFHWPNKFPGSWEGPHVPTLYNVEDSADRSLSSPIARAVTPLEESGTSCPRRLSRKALFSSLARLSAIWVTRPHFKHPSVSFYKLSWFSTQVFWRFWNPSGEVLETTSPSQFQLVLNHFQENSTKPDRHPRSSRSSSVKLQNQCKSRKDRERASYFLEIQLKISTHAFLTRTVWKARQGSYVWYVLNFGQYGIFE